MKPQCRTVIPSCTACGWEGRMTSPATAAHVLRMHSCDKHRRDQARAARAAARAASSGPEAPCKHDDRHPHGDRARYVLDLCRCRPCRNAAAAYERQRSRLVAYGTWVAYVDAGPVREHVAWLQANGMGARTIAAASGVSNGSITRLLYGAPDRAPSRRVRGRTARALLAVRPAPRDGARVPARGTIRRLQALVALGWTQTELGRRLSWQVGNISRVCHGHRDCVSARLARQVADLYEELSATPGPSKRARGTAARHGWAPPLAWDDIDLDDAPDMGGSDAPGVRRQRIEEFLELRDLGESIPVAAARVGISESYARDIESGTKGRRTA